MFRQQQMPRKRFTQQLVVRVIITLTAALAAFWVMFWSSQPLVRSTSSGPPAVVSAARGHDSYGSDSTLPALNPAAGLDGDGAAAWPSDIHYTSWQFKGVQMPRVAEGDIELVPICNASFVRQYPLTSTDFKRSYIPGSPCSMPPGLLQKMSSGQPVTITVVGGSMTQGRRCIDGQRWQRECSWTSRLQDRLRETFPTGNITVQNKAIPGFSYNHWLQSGMLDGLVQADVMIIDEQVNSHVSAGTGVSWAYKGCCAGCAGNAAVTASSIEGLPRSAMVVHSDKPSSQFAHAWALQQLSRVTVLPACSSPNCAC